MNFKPGKNKDLLFNDYINFIEGDLGKSEWVTVFELFNDKFESVDQGAFFCALIPKDKKEEVLEKANWDLLIGEGQPGFITYFEGEVEQTKYCRLGDDNGIEPLVYWRYFRNRGQAEISEEFRLYFNLYELDKNNKKIFMYTDYNGDEDEVAIIEGSKVDIKLKYIKEFLAAKEMYLAIYFEVIRFLKEALKDAGLSSIDSIKKEENYVYSLYTRNLFINNYNCQGWLLGKKLISRAEDFTFSFWESKQDEKYEEFIVGVDENGKEVLASCNTDYQSKPCFLTPVFFKREVLKKYYESPNAFAVEDGQLRREGFWAMRLMNNSKDYVVVWLGDLESIPYKEQAHWRAYNLTPSDRKLSHTDYTRNIEGKFSDPEHPELCFKYKLNLFQEAWYKKYDWYIFTPLSAEDKHHLRSLHVPTTKEQKEFDDQIASITKILIDSLNKRQLSNSLTTKEQKLKSIDILEIFLNDHGVQFPEMISFLRNLQRLRSTGVAHRKGRNYEKAKELFEIDKKDLPEVFEDILIKCIWVFTALEERLIKKSG